MKYYFSIFIMGISMFVMAQEKGKGPSFEKSPKLSVDLSLASAGVSNNAAISINRLHPIAFNNRFSVGYGIRFSGFYGQGLGYVTAPAEISEGNFFKVQNEEKLDTLFLSHSSLGMLNAAIYLNYKFTERISVSFNIDAIGFSFGADRNGRFEAVSQSLPVTMEAASVTSANWLLTGDYDHGSLNSELTIQIQLKEKISVTSGVSFVFTEFTTTNNLAFNNNRFRNKSLMPMLGASYRL